jgi:hypothetical protein
MWPFKSNDWRPVFVAEPDEYTVITTYAKIPIQGTERKEHITHTLYYSKSRNKYRIDWAGTYVSDREAIPSYIACVRKQIELEKAQIN